MPNDDHDLAAIAPALSFIREGGIEPARLVTAAQLLDNACSETAVVASLNQVLELSLGEDEARRALGDIVVKLARSTGAAPAPLDSAAAVTPVAPPTAPDGLSAQVSYVVRTVGKSRARRFLREATAFDLVPRPDMFGV